MSFWKKEKEKELDLSDFTFENLTILSESEMKKLNEQRNKILQDNKEKNKK